MSGGNKNSDFWGQLAGPITVISGFAAIASLVSDQRTAAIVFFLSTFIAFWFWFYPRISASLANLKPLVIAGINLVPVLIAMAVGFTTSQMFDVQGETAAPVTQIGVTQIVVTEIAVTQVVTTQVSPPSIPPTTQPSDADEMVWPPINGILDDIKSNERDIRCGIAGDVNGFSKYVSIDDAVGFDADYCRVIAAAVWGDATRVDFYPLGATERFSAVVEGKVDVLFRNTTLTTWRDTALNIDFGPVIFNDSQAIMTSDPKIVEMNDLSGKTICVMPNTTSEQNLRNELRDKRISATVVIESIPGRRFENETSLFNEYFADDSVCDAVTSDRSQLLSKRVDASDATSHFIISGSQISREPLAPVFIAGDLQWRNIIVYAVNATIFADEKNISRQSLISDTYENRDSLVVKYFLGEESSDRVCIGRLIGLGCSFARTIIELVGSYSDIYRTNLIDTGIIKVGDKRLGEDDGYGPNKAWNRSYVIEVDGTATISGGGVLNSPPFDVPPTNTPVGKPLAVPSSESLIPKYTPTP